MSISVVIPAYRGEESIAELVSGIKGELGNLLSEIVIVFDGGEPRCWESIQEVQKSNSQVIAIKLSRNFGQHNATICGFQYCSGEVVITMDEDLQHSPKDILRMVDELRDKRLDVVYGKYMVRQHHWFRNITSFMLKKMLEVGIPDLNSDYTSFRAIRTTIAKELLKMSNSYTFLDGYISWLTTNVGSVSVQHHTEETNGSSYTFKKLVSHMLNIFFTFSPLPIRIVSFSAFFLFFITLFFTLYVLGRAIVEPDYFLIGYPSLISILGFGFSIILYGVGVLGEYLQRINTKTTKRPNYLVSEVVSALHNHAK